MPSTDILKVLKDPPKSVPEVLKTTAEEITAILEASKKYEGKEESSTCKYLDLIIVIHHEDEASERLIVTPDDSSKSVAVPNHVKALPKLAEQLEQYLKLKYDTKDLKGDPSKIAIHVVLSNPDEFEERWLIALNKINELLLPFHSAALNEQRKKELAELRNKLNKIIGKDSKEIGDYQKVKKEVSELKAEDEEKVPANLPQWTKLMQETVLPDETVEAAVKKTFTILKTFAIYSFDPDERQEAALACALLARYQFRQDAKIYGYFYCIAMDAGTNEQARLFAIHELNKVILAQIKSRFGFVVKDKLKDRNVNSFCLGDPEFLPRTKLATLIRFLLNDITILSDDNKLNILLNTLLDTAYVLGSANQADIMQGYGQLSYEQLAVLQGMLTAVIAKKARDLIASKYSPPNGEDQKVKRTALQTLANELELPTKAATANVADEKSAAAKDSKSTADNPNKSFATRIIDAINAATSAAKDHPKLFSGTKGLLTKGTGSKTRDIFQLLLAAADVLNKNKLVGLNNFKLRELRGEKPPAPIAIAATKHGGPLGSSAAAVASQTPVATTATKPAAAAVTSAPTARK